jgi:glutamate dehydrogenase
MAELWADVESLDNDVPADIQTAMHLAILDLIRRGTLWFLRSCPRPLDIDSTVEAFATGVETLRVRFEEVLAPELKSNMDRRAEEFIAHRVPPDIAHRIAGLNALVPACDIVRIAAGARLDPCAVGSVYYGLGERFGLDWLRGIAETLSDGNEWQKMAVAAVIDDLYAHQSELTTKVLDTAGDAAIADAVVDAWTTVHKHTVGRVQALVSELRTSTTLDLAMLAVANREIRALVEAR